MNPAGIFYRLRVDHLHESWSQSDVSNQFYTLGIGIATVSLVAMIILRSPLLGVPACIAAGYYLGGLAKKSLKHYNSDPEFWVQLNRLSYKLENFYAIIIGVIFVASYVFPIGGAIGAMALGTYFGLLY